MELPKGKVTFLCCVMNNLWVFFRPLINDVFLTVYKICCERTTF